MRKYLFTVVSALSLATITNAQQIDKIINAKAVEQIERKLSSDEMQGRKTFTPGIDKAAEYIAEEFRKSGIQPVKGSYLQEFSVPQTEFIISGTVDGSPVNPNNVAFLSARETYTLTNDSTIEKITIKATDTPQVVFRRLQQSTGNYLILVDTAHAQVFISIRQARRINPAMKSNLVFLLGSTQPSTFALTLNKKTEQMPLKNVVGMIPGKSKPDEIVIFSAHYDHLGIGPADANGDSIYNGANDDAAGTTAVIMLANYFAKKKDNARTIVFAAFTGEEVGGFGARHFSGQFDSSKVMAMFNIEMIGTDSKWGKNSAYITGYEKTDLGKILEKNLAGTAFKFYPDPYPEQQLFYRSDNATLARQGVAAHTISTSKMDSEKFYHTKDDEIETLDMNNMAEIIKAIALSSTSIIAGKDTPTRVDTKQLR
ncbi:M28 family peptidase [Flavitalea sp.]|nr:M28 family peptidase [Flavitalea sp.]